VIPIVLTELGGNPEFGTMAEMVQAYFESVGLQTKMVEMDWASLGALGRAKTALVVNPMRNAPVRPSEAALVTFFTARGAPYGGYQNDDVEKKIDTLVATTDPAERERLTGEIFNFLFENYVDMPVASVKAEIVVNPAVVSDWTFPGVTTISLGHWHLIKKAN
jgi:ABC-type transport system substrate-binding protein